MKTVVIVGAGQMGRAAAEMLNPNTVEFLGFADNDKSKWTLEDGSFPEGEKRPVFSVETAVELEPEEIIISVLGDERARQLKEQIRICRFYGDIVYVKDLIDDFDIRSRCLGTIAERVKNVDGDIAELGVYRGNTAWQLNELFPDRKLYLFDTFKGFDARDLREEDAGSMDFSDTSAEEVLRRMAHPESCIVREGYFPDTTAGLGDLRFALVSLDPDLYQPTLAGLEFFYPKMNPGGMIIVHDYDNRQFEGVRKAVEEYEKRLITEYGLTLRIVPLGDMHGSCVIIK